MSLRIWLPMTKDLRNQGLDEVEVTNNGATIDNNGKIGKCYYFNGTAYLSAPFSYSSFTDEFSVALWVKFPNTVNIYTEILNMANSAGWANIYFGMVIPSNSTNIFCSVSNGSDYLAQTVGTGNIGTNIWTHVACTYKQGIIIVYVNGVVKQTYTTTIVPKFSAATKIGIGGASNGVEKSTCYLNDVRIYDHALSQKEISDLKNALILHYPLDNNGVGGENIMPNSVEMALGTSNASIGRWREAGSNSMTKSRVAINDSPIGSCYCFQNAGIQTPNDGSCYGIDSFTFEANTQYTISMWARIISGTEGYAGFAIPSVTYGGGSHSKFEKGYYVTTLPFDGKWIRCWINFTTNSSTNRNIYIGITTGNTNVTTQMCGVKIEKGDKVTPWCLNKNDALYSSMGMNDNIEYDTSGFGNNGTRVGDFSWSTDTPRYLVSTKLETEDVSVRHYITDSSFIRGELNLTTPNKLTIAFWANVNSYGGGVGNGVVATSNNSSLVPIDYNITALHHRDSQLDSQSSDGVRVSVLSPFINNEWHHYAFTYDGQNWKVYRDGELKATNSFTEAKNLATFGWIYFGYSQAGGLGRANNGYYSDARVYASCLSPEDILSLYQASAYIDSQGNTFASSYVEG